MRKLLTFREFKKIYERRFENFSKSLSEAEMKTYVITNKNEEEIYTEILGILTEKKLKRMSIGMEEFFNAKKNNFTAEFELKINGNELDFAKITWKNGTLASGTFGYFDEFSPDVYFFENGTLSKGAEISGATVTGGKHLGWVNNSDIYDGLFVGEVESCVIYGGKYEKTKITDTSIRAQQRVELNNCKCVEVHFLEGEVVVNGGTYEGGSCLTSGMQWNGGKAKEMTWEDGTFNSGEFGFGRFKGGVWNGGKFIESDWIDGTWNAKEPKPSE